MSYLSFAGYIATAAIVCMIVLGIPIGLFLAFSRRKRTRVKKFILQVLNENRTPTLRKALAGWLVERNLCNEEYAYESLWELEAQELINTEREWTFAFEDREEKEPGVVITTKGKRRLTNRKWL